MKDGKVMLRFEKAVRSLDPAAAFSALAESLKGEAMSKQAMYDLFDRQRAIHQGDADEAVYDAILDTMDRIVGWCSPQARLFDPDNTGST